MRQEGNPLDLNNLPEDYTTVRENGKQVLEESSSSAGGYRKKKSGGKDGKEECEKIYECRFCSLKFCKSQALGGHMNRHRQERETETLNRARQLVFSNDNLLAQGPHHLGGQPIPHGGFHQPTNAGDPGLPFRSIYPSRLFSGPSSTVLPPQPPPSQPYMYTSPPRLVSYPPVPPYPNDFYVGHVLPGNAQYSHTAAPNAASGDSNYTCVGAPVGHGLGHGGGSGGGGGGGGGSSGRDLSLHSQEEGLNWGRSYTGI